MVQFRIWHLFLIVFGCGILVVACLRLRMIEPIFVNHKGYSNAKYGLEINGPYEFRFHEQFTLLFHQIRADVIGLSDRIPFVLVVEYEEDLDSTLFAFAGANKGTIATTGNLEIADNNIEIVHYYSGLHYDGRSGDFDESELMIEVNDGSTGSYDLQKGRVFWILIDSDNKISAVRQQNFKMPEVEFVRQYLVNDSAQSFVKNIEKWLLNAKADKKMNQTK